MGLANRWHSDIIKNTVQFLRYEARIKQEVLDLVQGLGESLTKGLMNSGIDTPRSDFQRARLRALLSESKSTIADAYGIISEHQTLSLATAAGVSTGNLLAALNSSAGFDLLQGMKWSPNQLAALVDGTLVQGAPSHEWWARQSVDMQQAFSDQMRQGVMRGETITQMRDRIMGAGATKSDAIGKIDLRTISDPDLRGIVQAARRNAEALVRTSSMAVNNAAQQAIYLGNADVIGKFQWTATLDPRTCVRCGAQDGQTWPIGHQHAVPPLHWNCRCVVVPLTRSWEELATRNKDVARQMDEIWGGDPGTRAAIGGQVSGDTTWQTWLGGQSAVSQMEILGPTRYKLWDSGKLNLSDLVDQRGNAVTLNAMGRK